MLLSFEGFETYAPSSILCWLTKLAKSQGNDDTALIVAPASFLLMHIFCLLTQIFICIRSNGTKAAAGWPLSELFDRQITQQLDTYFNLNLSPVLDSTDRVPSLLNGGLDAISPLWWGFCLGLTAAIDLKGVQNSRYLDAGDDSIGEEYFPGNYGFDPFNLYPPDEEGQQRMQLAEIKHGRLSMLAVTGFAFQEYVSGLGVVDETPIFFQPLALGGLN